MSITPDKLHAALMRFYCDLDDMGIKNPQVAVGVDHNVICCLKDQLPMHLHDRYHVQVAIANPADVIFAGAVITHKR